MPRYPDGGSDASGEQSQPWPSPAQATPASNPSGFSPAPPPPPPATPGGSIPAPPASASSTPGGSSPAAPASASSTPGGASPALPADPPNDPSPAASLARPDDGTANGVDVADPVSAVAEGPDTDPDGFGSDTDGRWNSVSTDPGAAGTSPDPSQGPPGTSPDPSQGAAGAPLDPVAPAPSIPRSKPRTTGVAAAAAASAVGRGTAIRNRILPRSVLGVACLILAFAVGAGFSGVVLFSYYQYKLNQTNDRVNTLITGYKTQFANAEAELSASAATAKANIQTELKALEQLQAGPATLAALVKEVAPSVFFVHTLNTSGQASVGTAFVVSSSSTESLLLTSYTAVQAATISPGPTVYVQQGNTSTAVTVRSWDPEYDLAVLILPRPGLPALTAAAASPAPQPGNRIYAISGLGSAGASIVQGSIVDVSATGIAVDAAIASAFQGGPLINDAGQVLAVASQTYAPLGFSSQGVWYAPYVEAACNKVLTCPGGTLVGSH